MVGAEEIIDEHASVSGVVSAAAITDQDAKSSTSLVSASVIAPATVSTNFGYLSYRTFNIGDDIQGLAAHQFLPESAIGVERDLIADYSGDSLVKTVMNGWFMHTKENWFFGFSPSEKSWPPSDQIHPLMISMHFTDSFLPYAFSQVGIEYLKKWAPIGARDLWTLKALQQHGIDSYFSGCLTLTLQNEMSEKNEVIYCTDLDKDCVDYIRSQSSTTVVQELKHIISREKATDSEYRMYYANDILNKYKSAKCVITSRLHAALPCLALGTPVLLINTQPDQYRFEGLKELTRNCSKQTLLSGHSDFDFSNPSENPKAYLPLREQLIETMRKFCVL